MARSTTRGGSGRRQPSFQPPPFLNPGPPRPPPRTVPSVPQPAPPATTTLGQPGGMTDQQILDAYLAPQRLANEQAVSREAEYNRQRDAVIQGFTSSLMAAQAGVPAQVGQIYQTMQDQTM